jgi:hypothetical protein
LSSAPPVSQRIGVALVLREKSIARYASRTHGSGGEKSTDIQSTCTPSDARLAKTTMVPAGHGHEQHGASPAVSPGGNLDRDKTAESILASTASRS